MVVIVHDSRFRVKLVALSVKLAGLSFMAFFIAPLEHRSFFVVFALILFFRVNLRRHHQPQRVEPDD